MATSPIYNWPEPDNTDLVKNGALAIRTLGNAIDTTMATMVPKTIVDAKGDLIAGTAADTAARLAVGNNGETLVADSSTATGLRYGANFAAGKNKIINGDFFVNQRGFTSTTTSSVYIFDRFVTRANEGTTTFSAETFTTGAAPVAGYEFKNYLQIVSTGQTGTFSRSAFMQPIESVRTLAGQNATISFWARATSGAPSVACYASQDFGTGGSPSSAVDSAGQKLAITTSWARYSFTFAIPSISGKTLGTNNNDNLRFFLFTSAGSDWAAVTNSLGIQSTTIQFAGIQVEAGSVATAFQTATGTIQGELAACQRYYYRANIPTTPSRFGMGMVTSTTTVDGYLQFPTIMRTTPTAVEQSGTAGDYSIFTSGTTITVCSAVPSFGTASPFAATVGYAVASGLTAGQAAFIRPVNTNAYLGWSAEL